MIKLSDGVFWKGMDVATRREWLELVVDVGGVLSYVCDKCEKGGFLSSNYFINLTNTYSFYEAKRISI